jgi:hypothetical protein
MSDCMRLLGIIDRRNPDADCSPLGGDPGVAGEASMTPGTSCAMMPASAESTEDYQT